MVKYESCAVRAVRGDNFQEAGPHLFIGYPQARAMLSTCSSMPPVRPGRVTRLPPGNIPDFVCLRLPDSGVSSSLETTFGEWAERSTLFLPVLN